jgi:hypothetical protein
VSRVEFSYDGDGHRSSVTTTPASGSATSVTYRYSGDSVVEEKVGGTVTRSYVLDEAGSIVKLVISVGQANAGSFLPMRPSVRLEPIERDPLWRPVTQMGAGDDYFTKLRNVASLSAATAWSRRKSAIRSRAAMCSTRRVRSSSSSSRPASRTPAAIFPPGTATTTRSPCIASMPTARSPWPTPTATRAGAHRPPTPTTAYPTSASATCMSAGSVSSGTTGSA